ncbi:hypothetical protein WKH57_28340 [Niallia taxi]|uniref:hypothetical protein n=1 Tax=Niallia taxi TaxID=2499688 RepID=UPI00317D2D52
MKFYAPDKLPTSLFYFAWKKAKYFVEKNSGFYDPIDIKAFEMNLDQNLEKLRKEFINLFNNCEPIIGKPYFIPKSSNGEEKRYRIMTHFNIKDQVTWTVVLLALADWFDTNDDLMKLIPIKDMSIRNNYPWMVSWSYNNRIKRVSLKDNLINENRRLYTHFNNKNLYESFQWSLRNLREERKKQFEQVRESNNRVFYGEADIKDFYPTLRIDYIKEAIFKRLNKIAEINQLKWHGKSSEKWMILLNNLLKFDIEFEVLKQEEETLQLVANSILETDNAPIEELFKLLKTTLPTNLIASGFLSNCALTEFFDCELEKYMVKIQKENDEKVFITRYTDDIMVISSNQKVVSNMINKIAELLNNMELSISVEKCRPKPFSSKYLDIENDINNFVLNEYKSKGNNPIDERILKYIKHSTNKLLNNDCPVVEKHEKIPGSTTVIEKLSQLNDQTLWAMNNKEIEKYLIEVLKLMEVTFSQDEIRDETKVTFTAWRVRKGAEELISRSQDISHLKIREALERSIKKYPYKLTLLDYYILHLFDRTKFEPISDIINKLLENLKQTDNNSTLGSHGGYIRTRFIYTVIHNWHLVSPNHRNILKGIIYEGVLGWYTVEPTWHEKIAIYWLLTILGINREPGITNIKMDSALENMKTLFLTSRMQVPNLTPKTDLFTSLILDSFRLRKNNSDLINKVSEIEEKEWIHWRWESLLKENDEKLKKIHLNTLIMLIKYNKEVVPINGFRFLIKKLNSEFISISEGNRLIYLEAISIVDSIIEEWVRSPSSITVSNFMLALSNNKKNQDKYNRKPLREYSSNKIINLSEIIKVLKLEPLENINSLPQDILQTIGLHKGDKKIPLIDWLNVTENLFLSNTKVNQPLSELEIASLILSIIPKFNTSNYFYINPHRLVITIKDWKEWRNNNNNSQQNSHTVNIDVIEGKDPLLGGVDNTFRKILDEITETQKDFSKCYVLSTILFRLLVKQGMSRDYYNVSNLLSWKGLQEFLKKGSFPSTRYVALLVSTLNASQFLYKDYYQDVDYTMLPYKQITPYKRGIILKEYKKEIQEQYNYLKQNYLSWNNGVIEKIIIDVDMLIKEQERHPNER